MRSVDEEIGEAHIGMDEAEPVRRLAEALEASPDQGDGSGEKKACPVVDADPVPP